MGLYLFHNTFAAIIQLYHVKVFGFFFNFGGERGGFHMTTKHNGYGDKNVSLNKQIVTAEMEDGEERLLFCEDKQHVCLLLVYFQIIALYFFN